MPRIYKPQNELGNTLVDITKIGYNNGNEFEEGFITIQNKIEAEETRATTAENALQESLNAEVSRAAAAETQLQTNIDNEETRAIEAESLLQENINTEITRAANKEEELNTAITTETERATSAESVLNDKITAETTRATAAEATLQTNIDNETERATSAESGLNDKITAEETRASGVESELDTRISNLENSVIKTIESDSYINANNTEANKVNLTVNVSTGNNNSSVSSTDEENTLTRVKDVNAAITYEVNRATAKENELNAAITAEVSRAEGVESGFNTRITTLESDRPKIISVTGQTITNPTEITMGSEVIFSTDSNIAIDTALSSITQNTSIGWTVKNTNATNNISVTNNSEVVKSIEPNTSISGKWIKNTEGITISVFKRALGEEGNNYITWGSENNTEVTVNVPDDVDLPLSFYERGITKATLNMGGTTKMSHFFYSCPSMLELSINAPNVIDISFFLWGSKITAIDWSFPQATNCDRLCPNNIRVTSTRLDLPNATICNYLTFGQSSLTEAWINAPKATKVQAVFGNIPVVTLTFNLASVATFDLTVADPANNNQLGKLPKLQNLTILEGGLASCTSFNISTSTLLTDESIQNIIYALPDYSGTETTALVTFPPGRLTTEQQEAITAKGWTWA